VRSRAPGRYAERPAGLTPPADRGDQQHAFLRGGGIDEPLNREAMRWLRDNAGDPRRAEVLQLPPRDFDGTAGDDVWRVVVERARAGSRPGQRADTARIALAIEGGGMAGAVSAGMCVALESLGLISSFDAIYGSSSGAMNASYTAAGQARSRADLYPRAAEEGMIDPRRVLRGRPPFRLSDVVGSLFHAHPHDRRVLDGRPPLRVVATRVEDRGLEVLADFACLDELRQAVQASCAIPYITGDVVAFRGRRYVDGALIESLPYGAALRDGATHVLLLRTRHVGHRIRAYPAGSLRVIDRLLRDAPDTVAELVRERPERYNAEADALQSSNGRLSGRVCQLAPPGDEPVPSQFEARPRRIVAAVRLGARIACETIAPYLATVHGGRVEHATAA
jgi:predicted patatin/cPLA2 family phospholipase